MKNYIFFRKAGANWVRGKHVREQPLWDEHAVYMDKLFDEGLILLAGPYADMDGALVIVQVDDERDVSHFFDDDPWVIHDILTSGEIKEWKIFLDARRRG
jgi:hypothetical protein